MKIKILGTRGKLEASAPYHSLHSGLLVNNDLLLDLGEKEFLDYNPTHIFFTHLHSDHAFFVQPGQSVRIDIPMSAPETYRAPGIAIKKLTSHTKIGRYDIRPIPTVHSHELPSQAYLISGGGKRFLYTGDMLWIKKWYHRYFRDINLVITEASTIDPAGLIRRHEETGRSYGHAGIPRLVKLFSQFCGHLVLVHYGSWFYNDSRRAHRMIKDISRKNNVRLDAGYDNMELEI